MALPEGLLRDSSEAVEGVWVSFMFTVPFASMLAELRLCRASICVEGFESVSTGRETAVCGYPVCISSNKLYFARGLGESGIEKNSQSPFVGRGADDPVALHSVGQDVHGPLRGKRLK